MHELTRLTNKINTINWINEMLDVYAYKYDEFNLLFNILFCDNKELYNEIISARKYIINNNYTISQKKRYIKTHFLKPEHEKMIPKFISIIDFPYTINTRYGSYNLKMDFELLFTLFLEFMGTKRTRFPRELERILVTKSFRHLQYKTQVMINSASDDQRTRLLHTLEVQKIARTLAIQLKSNWELAETLSVGHDVGHTSFGHAGEDALNECLEEKSCGNFSHALQSVRVLNYIESHEVLEKYGLSGIGLSKATLDGILKHDADSFIDDVSRPGFQLQYNCKEFLNNGHLEMGSVEAQIVYWSDKISYMAHDWDEFISGNLLEKMIQRLNDFVHSMYKINRNYKKNLYHNTNYNECEFVKELVKKIDEITSSYNKRSLDNDKIKKNLSELVEKATEYKTKGVTIFPEELYEMFLRYFSVSLAWINFTHDTPEKIDESNDLVFVMYTYLRKMTSRKIKIKFLDRIFDESINRVKNIEKYSLDTFDIKRNANIANINDPDIRKELKREYRNSLIISMNDYYLDNYEIIDKFIYNEYVKCTAVKNMTYKAKMIIKKLFNHYFENPDMLPFEYRNRLNREIKSINEEYCRIYCNYLKENISNNEKNSDPTELILIRLGYKNTENIFPIIEKWLTNIKLLNKENDEIQIFLSELRENMYIKNSIKARAIADYIANMTDRMATKKYNEIISSKTTWSVTYQE